MGSVFSPLYAKARRSGPASPYEHVASNLALYTLRGKEAADREAPGRNIWTFTEQQQHANSLSAHHLRVGANVWRIDDTTLRIEVHDVSMPWRKKVAGHIEVSFAQSSPGHSVKPVCLNSDGHHMWWPIAPVARIEVNLKTPHLRWRGHAYVDCNKGDRPLASGFTSWTWLRTCEPNKTRVMYAVTRAQRGDTRSQDEGHGFIFDGQRPQQRFVLPTAAPLPATSWGLPRTAPLGAKLIKTLENTPFYARSVVDIKNHDGVRVPAMHETLDMRRWQQSWVQKLMRFRMRRLSAPKSST